MTEIINDFLFLTAHFHSKIVELEEELRVVGNNLKSLEVSEEKVKHFRLPISVTQKAIILKNLNLRIMNSAFRIRFVL